MSGSLDLYHREKAYIIEHSMDDGRADLVADIADLYERKYQTLDEQIPAVLSAKWKDLVPLYRSYRGVAA